MTPARVLIVDDEALVRFSLRERLTADGHDTLEAGLASEAFDVMARTAIDVILLDLELPGSDAVGVVKEIAEDRADTQVILMSEPSRIERAVEAMAAGAFDYVNKPLNLDEVSLRVRRALDVRDLRREVDLLRSSQLRKGARRTVPDAGEM